MLLDVVEKWIGYISTCQTQIFKCIEKLVLFDYAKAKDFIGFVRFMNSNISMDSCTSGFHKSKYVCNLLISFCLYYTSNFPAFVLN